MLNLKETLESFSLSEDTRRKILNENHPFGNQGSPFIPSEFKEIAQIALAGHFLVSAGPQQITVQPTCVEFYYHEEAEGGIKDPIVYHRNLKTTHVCRVLLSRRGRGWHQRPHRISSQPQKWFSQGHLQVGHPAQPCFRNRHHIREGHPSQRSHQGISANT